LLSVLNGDCILQGILVISGKTVFRILTSEYFSNSSVIEILSDVLPIIISCVKEGLEEKEREL
jgi:hypothetical protein